MQGFGDLVTHTCSYVLHDQTSHINLARAGWWCAIHSVISQQSAPID